LFFFFFFFFQFPIAETQFFFFLPLQTSKGFAFAKISRPSRIARSVLFSDVAVMNINPKDNEYRLLQFRMMNTRRSALINTRFRLLLLRRETPDGTPIKLEIASARNQKTILRVHELDFQINTQWGNMRVIDTSLPMLPLPWVVTHELNQNSPLKDWTPASDDDIEIIAVVEGVDEAVAQNIQARWSYTNKEIVWDCEFVEMVHENKKKRKFVVDVGKLSAHVYSGPNPKQNVLEMEK
jgi:inward rectifier potassium channel